MIHPIPARRALLIGSAAALLAVAPAGADPVISTAPFAGFQNKALVGVGRVPANGFDKLGHGVDTLGGVFSAMYFAPEKPARYKVGNTVNGTLFSLPDRGFGDGTQDYVPRYHAFKIAITPHESGVPTTAQNQVSLQLQLTDRFEYERRGRFFTGHDADPSFPLFPRSFPGGVVQQFAGVDVVSPASLGAGRRSMDPEGIVRASDGTFWISDEYGPLIYHFDKTGLLIETMSPGNDILPLEGAVFGSRVRDFAASDLSISSVTGRPESGRNDNRGLEGLTITPNGKRLVAMLQSPTLQDSGSGTVQRNEAVNCRVVVFDIEAGSVTRGRVLAEYVYQVGDVPSVQTGVDALGAPVFEKRATAISEILAINDHQFLLLDRDGYGRGQTEVPRDGVVPVFKKIVLIDTDGATNIATGAYSLERGAYGQLNLPFNGVPADDPATTTINEAVVPVQAIDFVDLLAPAELAKFNLNVNSHAAGDANTLGEKWEGLALAPLHDAAHPNDFLLLVGTDNDFKASTVVHNARVVGTNAVAVDTMILAYRVTLPGYQPQQ